MITKREDTFVLLDQLYDPLESTLSGRHVSIPV